VTKVKKKGKKEKNKQKKTAENNHPIIIMRPIRERKEF